MNTFFKTAAVLSVLLPFSARADMFELTLTQNSNSVTKSYKSVTDLFDKYKNGELDSIMAGYDATADSDSALNFRGIEMRLNYTGNKLRFVVPSIDVDQTFGDGTSQTQAFNAFKNYLEKNKDGLLSKILKESVTNTPYDAVAGSPSSLMGQMADAAFFNPVLDSASRVLVSGTNDGTFVAAPNATVHRLTGTNKKDKSSAVVSLPLGYAYKFDNDWAVAVDVPLTYVNTDGSSTYAVQAGLSVQIPLYRDNWTVTAAGRMGATASSDMLSGGILYMGSATSNLSFALTGSTRLTVTNMYARVQDYKAKTGDFEIDYDLRNNVLKNGASIRQMIGTDYALTVFGYNTKYTGSKLYIDEYNEGGFRLTKYLSGKTAVAGWDVMFSAAKGDNYEAFRAAVSLLF